MNEALAEIQELSDQIAQLEHRKQALMARRDIRYIELRGEGVPYATIGKAAGCRGEAVAQRLRLIERRQKLGPGSLS